MIKQFEGISVEWLNTVRDNRKYAKVNDKVSFRTKKTFECILFVMRYTVELEA